MDDIGQINNPAPVKRKIPLLFEAVLMLFLPLLGFFLYSFLLYPLKPHCTTGTGLLGCVPMCETVSSFEDGTPSNFKEVPCFHDDTSKFQIFSYKQPLPYYSLFVLPLILISIFVGIDKMYILLIRISFYPYFIFTDIRKNKNLPSKFFLILLLFPLTIEWLFGYVIVISELIGVNLL